MYFVRHYLPSVVRKNLKPFCTSVGSSQIPEAVMSEKVLEHIQPTKNAVVFDMTFGSGGHSRLILDSDPTVKVVALDRDQASYKEAQSLAEKYPGRLVPLCGKFSDLPRLIEPLGYGKASVDVMMFDCGCSTIQMKDLERGFSHDVTGKLDMRMDVNESDDSLSAYDVLHSANEIDLKNIFKLYGGLSCGKKMARAILYTRHTKAAVKSTTDLAELLVAHCDLSSQELKSTFRSLRYFVNNELNEISHGILLAEWYLKSGGRLLTISEDRIDDSIIKNHLVGTPSGNFVGLAMGYSSYTPPPSDNSLAKKSCWTKLNKHVIIPDGEKLLAKTRKLRAVVKE